MSSKDKNLSLKGTHLKPLDKASIGVVTSRWNEEITSALRNGCLDTLKEHGLTDQDITQVMVPGAFELPAAARMLLSHKNYDAVICLGCVIKGETQHDEYINQSVAMGLMTLSVSSGKPVVFGVLTPNNQQQALDRAGGVHGNKGVEAALTAIEMIHLSRNIKSADKKTIGF